MKMDQGQRRRCCELEELDSETLAEMVVELEAKVFAQSSVTREDRQRWELESLREWLSRHLQTNTMSRHTGKGGHNGDGTTWAAVAIPDWDVKQRVERITAALEARSR